MKKTVAMLGHGSFGTAMATVLAANGHTVHLWCYEAQDVPIILQTGCNPRYLPEVPLAGSIIPTADLSYAIAQSEYIAEAIPVRYLRSVIEQTAPYANRKPWTVLSKGIEQKTFQLPSQIIEQVIGPVPIVVCAGPNFAREIAEQKLSAAAVASSDLTLAQNVAQLFQTNFFKTLCSSDPIGVQLAGVCKNVYSIGLGILYGLNAAENSRAFFTTQAVHELSLLIATAGGEPKTAFGLSGLGDLCLSVMGTQSRNVQLGITLATGTPLTELQKTSPLLPEGVNSAQSIAALAKQHNVSLPLASAIHEILCATRIPESLYQAL